MTDFTAPEGRTPLTEEELAEQRRAHCGSCSQHKVIDRLRAENTALAAKLEAVQDVIAVKDPEWKPLSERYPEYFTPDTPEEAARKKGWKQGVDLQTQRIRAALGGDQDGGDRDAAS